MRDNKTFLTATTALVSCLSLVAPQMTLAQGNSNAGADKLPVCSSVEGDVPCREPGKKGKAKGKEGDTPAEETAEDAPASEAPDAAEAGDSEDAPEAQDAVEAPEVKPGADPEKAPEAAGADDAPAEPPKAETAEPATPAEDADKPRAAEDATPPKKPADAAKEQTAEDADDSQRPKSRADAEAEAEADVQAESDAEAEADAQAEAEAEAEADVQAESDAETEPDAQAEEQTVDSLEEELRDEDAQSSADAEADAEVEVDEQTADSVDTPAETGSEAEQTADTAAEATTAPGNAGETPAAVRAEGEPEEVEETTVTEQTARSSDEEFETRVDAEAETQADADAKTQADADAKTQADAKADGGGGGGGLSDFEKFAIGAAGLVALDALLDNDDEVVTNSGDRVVVRRDGNLEVYRDDNELLRRPGSEVRTETYSDGSTRTVVTRENGTRIVTITDATGRVLRRTKIRPNGTEVVLVDDTHRVAEVDVRDLPRSNQDYVFDQRGDRDALRAALRADAAGDLDRSFSLYQVRNIPQVRELMPEITVEAINFRSDSAAIRPREAEELRALGEGINEFLDENPDELFLIEGHTDAVGNDAYNLALSDRRAESVALALTEYFDVPPENMVIQGYGESQLRVETEESSRENRRAVVRRITPLLETASR